MTLHFANWDDRTLDLAVDRFTEGLGQEDQAALDQLTTGSDLEDFEQAIAAIHLAQLSSLEEPPAELLSRLGSQGKAQLDTQKPQQSTVIPMEPRRSRAVELTGWLVAAGLLLTILLLQPEPTSPLPTEGVRREALIASASDLVQVAWTATEDPAAEGASGDVVWSSDAQEGYMTFSGLAANDPSVEQYQLWIFDPSRADWEAKPVDGGVFDVSADGLATVPINPKLAVSETALFAVTVEVPGGVVVSERERIVLTASP